MRRLGLQAELIASLSLVAIASSLVLAALAFLHEEAHLRELLGRSLLAEAREPPGSRPAAIAGTRWWKLRPDGSVEGLGFGGGALDPSTQALGKRAAAEGRPLVQPGFPWEPIRFAAPGSDASVLVARLPEGVSWRLRAGPLVVLLAVAFANVAVFVGFGVWMTRRRVVMPLQRLAAAARAIADGAFEARVAVEGPREPAEVALAFNEMTEALERRTGALEKAVVDLREANRRLRETREGLVRAQRLAAVGRLAAGVAHEVGNPIGAILALLDLAQRDPGLSESTREHLGRAAREGERTRIILRQLLEFSRPPRMAREVVDVAEIARETVGLVSAQRQHREVRFEIDAEPELRAWGDPGAVAQVLLNLLLNAADAVAGAPEPRVWVSVRGAVRERRAEDAHRVAAPDRAPDTVECIVADNGIGIAPEDRDRIFDPFFTTKPAGEGSGLGLANSARLAEEQSGELELAEPPPAARTAFALRLPRAVDRQREAGASETASACGVRNALRPSATTPSASREQNPQE